MIPCASSQETAAAAAKLLQSCLTLCDPIDGSPPGSPVPGILQARTLEWVAIFFSNAWKWKEKVKSLSRVRLFATPSTTAYQVAPSMGFSRQEYWPHLNVCGNQWFHPLQLLLRHHFRLFAAHGLEPARLLCPRDFPRQEHWSGLPFPPLPTQGSNPCLLRLLHCRRILYHWADGEGPSSILLQSPTTS